MKKRKDSLLYFFPVLVFVALAMLLSGSMNADAAPALIRANAFARGQHNSRAGGGNLTYHGGPVMEGTANAYAIFWEPTGSFVSTTYNSLITRYFKDVGSSSLYHIDTQYTDSAGKFASNAIFAASWVDTQKYPATTLSDANIRSEVAHAQSVNGWKTSLDNVFFVFLAKGENVCTGGSCSFTTFCAYHSNFGSTIYATIPYTGTNLAVCGVHHSPNGDFDADSSINVTSHEQNEAATDPYGTAWFDATGSEIGDKCAWKFGSLNAQGGDVSWNGDAYYVQKEWDDHASGCRIAGP